MINNCTKYLNKLCLEILERPVGSEGNRQATRYFRDIVTSFGWEVEGTLFDAIDWKQNGATLTVENHKYQVGRFGLF